MARLLQIIVALFICFLAHGAIFAQEDLTQEDSIPAIPTVTDTLSLDSLEAVAEDSLEEEETAIQYDIDTLYWNHQSASMQNFLAKLNNVLTTKQGNLHIIHMGGSHVQAGTMTRRFRHHLLEDWGQVPAERGFIFPYSAAPNCNTPYDYRITKDRPFGLVRNVYRNHTFPLGASGIAVWNSDANNSFSVKMNDNDYDFTADTIVLWGSTRGWPNDPILKEDTLYHFPDSIDYVNGHYFYYFDKPVRDFTFYLPCSKGDTFIVNGIQLKNGNPGITVSSIGVNGAQVTSYLRCQNFARDIAFLKPDLIIFGIGVNDAYGKDFDSVAFKNNYLKLVSHIRQSNPECAFLFLTNNDTWKRGRKGKYYVNPTGPVVEDVMFRLADLTGGAVWDQFAVMGGLRSMETWRRKGLAQKDRVHFTAAGYNLIGDLFYNAFIREIKNNQE